MTTSVRLSNLSVLLLACLTAAALTTEVTGIRTKRHSIFGDIKHLSKSAIRSGKRVLDNAKDAYKEREVNSKDYENAKRFCRSLGIEDRKENLRCVQDLTQNFITGSVLALFRGNQDSVVKKHDSGSRRRRKKTRRNDDQFSELEKRLAEMGLNLFGPAQAHRSVKEAKRRIDDVSDAIKHSWRKKKD